MYGVLLLALAVVYPWHWERVGKEVLKPGPIYQTSAPRRHDTDEQHSMEGLGRPAGIEYCARDGDDRRSGCPPTAEPQAVFVFYTNFDR